MSRPVFEGFGPYAETAIAELGLADVTTPQLAALRPLLVANSLISQAFHRGDLTDSQRADIVAQAARQHAILSAGARTIELMLAEAENRLTAPTEAAPE